jgi:hypothetical protein
MTGVFSLRTGRREQHMETGKTDNGVYYEIQEGITTIQFQHQNLATALRETARWIDSRYAYSEWTHSLESDVTVNSVNVEHNREWDVWGVTINYLPSHAHPTK